MDRLEPFFALIGPRLPHCHFHCVPQCIGYIERTVCGLTHRRLILFLWRSWAVCVHHKTFQSSFSLDMWSPFLDDFHYHCNVVDGIRPGVADDDISVELDSGDMTSDVGRIELADGDACVWWVTASFRGPVDCASGAEVYGNAMCTVPYSLIKRVWVILLVGLRTMHMREHIQCMPRARTVERLFCFVVQSKCLHMH